MSLTQSDLQEMRNIVHSTVQAVVGPIIEPLAIEIKALRNDIKENYKMSAKLQSSTIKTKSSKNVH